MPTMLFLSEACLFDRKSGAAQSVRAQLKALARASWQAHALTMTLFDGQQEYPLAQVHPDLSPLPPVGSLWVQEDEGVTHTLYVTHSTVHQAVRPGAVRAFIEVAQQSLTQLQPDVVLTYSSPLLQPLLAQAQKQGAHTVFYVANPGYARAESPAFRFINSFVVPSQAMVALYRKKLGIRAQVVRDLVRPPLDGRLNLSPARVATRKAQRFVTLINPEPAKGGLFFLNLVEQARVLAPGLRFRALESRWGRADWARLGVDPALLDAVDWQPRTDDMTRIYGEASLLLVPSLWFEASARVVAEGLLAGVPVLAMKSGGTDIPVDKALDHVFGYGVGLDMTRRDLQNQAKDMGRPWDMGKGFDQSAPIGEIFPAAKIGHPSKGTIQLDVNGKTRQKSDLNALIWSVPETISYLSGLVALAGFALPPLAALGRVPPLRVLRRDLLPVPASSWLVYGAALLALGLIMWRLSLDLQLTLALLGGGLITALLLGGLLLAQLWQHLGKEGGGLGGWVAILHRVAPECPSNLADVLRRLAVIAPQEPAHAPLHKFGGEQGIKGGRLTQIDPGVVKGREIAPQMAVHSFDTLRSERLWQA